MKKIFSTLVSRWNAESPTFFVKLQKLGISLVGVSATIYGFEYIQVLPSIFSTVASNSATAGLFIALISKFTVKDKAVL